MLLKIITNCHKTKIITGIQDAEIWDKIVSDRLITDLNEVINYASSLGQIDKQMPAEFLDGSPVSHGVITYDEFPEDAFWVSADGNTGGKMCYDIRVIDYLKDGQWHRVAIADHAYLCNDEGRTIQKIA
jgi:hypothetical protein